MESKGPTLWHERRAMGRGYRAVIGVDEVGRGALAGPVVAGAVAISNSQLAIFKNIGIDDSKRLRPRTREWLAKVIKKNAVWGIGEIGVAKINKLGIARAVAMAMRSAVKRVRDSSANARNYVLVDAFHVKYVPGVGLKNQKAIVKGDQKSLSIAAASIIAKVYRDKLMYKLYKNYKSYSWGKNKGYGTKEHLAAIGKFGVSRLHRLAFVKKFL